MWGNYLFLRRTHAHTHTHTREREREREREIGDMAQQIGKRELWFWYVLA